MPSHLIALDVDNCLMPVNGPPDAGVRDALADLVARGAHLVLASGKPCVYLSGLTRGLGLMETSLIGENGAEIWVTSTMPPVRLLDDPADTETAALAGLRDRVRQRYGPGVFLQPNTVGVTAFPTDPSLTPARVAAEMGADYPGTIGRYVHLDSVDWTVARFTKGTALLRLADHLGVPGAAIAAVGDGANDLPMLQVAALALWLGDSQADLPPHVVHARGLHDALAALAAWVGQPGL